VLVASQSHHRGLLTFKEQSAVDKALSITDSFQIRWLTLTFPKDLEKAFRESYFQNSLLQVRTTFLLGVFFYSAFGILDQWMVPEAKHMLWFIRYGIFAPYALALYLFSFTRYFKRYMQPSIAFGVLLAGLGIAAMVLIAPYPASYSYYAGLLLVFIYGYTFVRLRFWWATTTGWLIVVAYEVSAVGLTSTPIPVLVNNNFFFLAANILCMFVCYAIEYYSRRDFIQARMLEVEKKKVVEVNHELESRVQERTAQLEIINEELKQEINERKRTEKERRYLEAQLRKSQKMEAIGTLAGGVAHDLNNILSGLVSYPELLLMGLPADSPLRQPLLTIKESGDKAAAIVQDLLTLARRGVSVREIVNLNQVVEQYLQSPEHRKIFESHAGIRMETCLAPDLLNVVGSPVHLSKTLMNLVSNALEAMPSGGRLCIRTENRYVDNSFKGFDAVEEGDFAVLTVSDTGVGISPEDVERIFEPFYTKKTMGRSGTGLGMAVVWGTVKDHDGYIDVNSELGEGTTFSLYFPITWEMPAEEKVQIPLERYRGHGESILVIDDIKEQREIASEMLRKMGYNVISVPSGEEAVYFLKENKADLLVLDMIMNPGMDGLDTYRKILKYHPDQRAIIASGYSESDRVKQAQRMGAGVYVKKPYSFENIGLAVKAELDKNASF
jgi:signal transduction histidine kinase/ActR/RegA family two-component response regulator